MRRFVMVMLSLVICIGLLAACGKNGGGSADNAASTSEAVKAGDSGGKKVTIRMAVSGSEQEKKLRYETADLFMKDHPNIKVEWIDIGNERYQKTLTLLSGGNAPDILYINDWTIPLAKRGVLLPLNDFIDSDSEFKIDEFYPDVIDAYKSDGTIYGLPQEISPLAIYYNKDLFDKAGVPYPTDDWTQEDFLSAASHLTDPAKKQYGYIHENWYGHYGGWFLRNGGSMFTADGTAGAFESPEILAGLDVMKKLVVDDHSSPNPAEMQAMGQGADAMFRNQQAAMFSAGMWMLPPFKSEPLKFKWDVVRMPKAQNQATKAGVLSWSIYKGTKNSKEAWEVLKFFVGHEGMKIVAKYNMALPASKVDEANQIILDSKFPENVKAFVDSAALVNMEEFKQEKWSEISVGIQEQLDLMLLGKQSAEDTQKSMVAKVKEISAK